MSAIEPGDEEAMQEGRLYTSRETAGRYQVGNDGPDLTSGEAIEVKINGQWIHGRVEHGALYTTRDDIDLGYYVQFAEGIVGLCVGMRVRLVK